MVDCSVAYSVIVKMLKNTRQNDEVPLLNDVLNGIYPNDEDSTDAEASSRRIPAYRAAILTVCQLQLKICSKLIKLSTPSSPATISRSTFKLSTLKRLAGRSVLRHSGRNPCGLVRIFRRKIQFNDGNGNNDNVIDGSCYHQVLPTELIKFLQDGATDGGHWTFVNASKLLAKPKLMPGLFSRA